VRVINQWGAPSSEQIRAAVPGVEVVDLERGEVLPEDETADVLFTFIRPDWNEPGSPVELARRHKIPWLQFNGAGIEHFPEELFEGGRVITNGRTAASSAISEFVLASMLAFAKRFPLTWLDEPPPENPMPASRWLGYDESETTWGPPTTWGWGPLLGLEDKTVGLVGFGGIAQGVARKALAFDMRVIANRKTSAPSPIAGVEMIQDLRDLLPLADHLVLAIPLTPDNHHLLNEESLALVKPGVHIVNISRGGHIDNDALRRALDDGRVAFASLDVHDPTPLPAGHWVYEHPRVHMSPHLSWVTPKGPQTVEIFVANLKHHLAGEPLDNVVDLTRGY
jgi:phosphoglycerate dehydrogenase-like enzyme